VSQARPRLSHLVLADTPNAVAWARRHTVDILSRWQVPPDLVETARLLVSELTTNAIRHAEPADEPAAFSPLTPVGTVGLMLWLDSARLVLQVQDHDPRPPVVKSVGEDAENGRGLFLVDGLSSRWGYYYPTPGLKAVWAELSRMQGPGRHPPERPRGDEANPPTVPHALIG
jgi:Histidine kinase-like ATPase domain